jgi:hypothetical protein
MASSRTRTSIANMAADFLSATVIGNITEGMGDAQVYERNYEEAVETVLAEFPWLAGKARAILQMLDLTGQAAQNETGYATAYALPTDCIRPLTINDRPVEEIHWEIETIALVDQFGKVLGRRRVLYCDETGTLSLKYAAMIEPGDMTAHLAKAVGIELAIRCEAQVTNSTSRGEKLRRDYQEATKGSSFRVGGYQVDSRSQNPKPQRKGLTAGQLARMGHGL